MRSKQQRGHLQSEKSKKPYLSAR